MAYSGPEIFFVYVLILHAKILEGNFWIFVKSNVKSSLVSLFMEVDLLGLFKERLSWKMFYQ